MAWTEKYCSPTGGGAHDGSTAGDAWTLAEAITNVASGNRVNVIAGTYANTTTDRTLSTNGTTTAPIWWRGYNTTIGDIDSNNALTKPAITFTTARFITSGSHQIFSGLDISGARTTNSQVSASGQHLWFHRCRFENTGANANSSAVVAGSNGEVFFDCCWFKATGTATQVVQSSIVARYWGCTFRGGGVGLTSDTGLIIDVANCVFIDNGSHGININTTARQTVNLCSFHSCGGDGIRFTTAPTFGVVSNCIFNESGGYGINNASGSNIATVRRCFNLFYGNTSGTENGFGDYPSFNGQTDSASSFVNAGSSDFGIATGSNAISNGIPIGFENETFTGYLDIGAVQKAPGSGSGGSPRFGMAGGGPSFRGIV